MSKDQTSDDSVPDDFRWQLAADFRKRTDQSADFLRAFLLALSSGSVAYVVNQDLGKATALHSLSFGFLAAAILLIFVSWNVQKSKSINRYKILRDKGYEDFKKEEQGIEGNIFRWNTAIDLAAYFFMMIGIVFEVSAKVCTFGIR